MLQRVPPATAADATTAADREEIEEHARLLLDSAANKVKLAAQTAAVETLDACITAAKQRGADIAAGGGAVAGAGGSASAESKDGTEKAKDAAEGAEGLASAGEKAAVTADAGGGTAAVGDTAAEKVGGDKLDGNAEQTGSPDAAVNVSGEDDKTAEENDGDDDEEEDEEEEEEEDTAKEDLVPNLIDCKICGLEIPLKSAIVHMHKCFRKKEAGYAIVGKKPAPTIPGQCCLSLAPPPFFSSFLFPPPSPPPPSFLDGGYLILCFRNRFRVLRSTLTYTT